MSEQKLEVFNVLNFLNSGYEIENILKEGQFGTFSSSEECTDYLIKEGYLKEGAVEAPDVEITEEYISNKYVVSELKDILRENGLKVSGTKQELIERALPVLEDENNLHNLDAYSNTSKSGDLELTDKAYDFLSENQWIDLYMFALVQFHFTDYETFVARSDADMIQTAHNFCDEVLSRAFVSSQFIVFRLALSAKAHVFAYEGDYESFLDYDLQHYILGLNPMSLTSEEYEKYNVIDEANIINLKNVLEKLQIGNLKKRFDAVWKKSHIKHTTVPKKICYKILQRALDGADIEDLNMDIKEKFFYRKFGI